MRIFVDERSFSAPPGTTVLDVVAGEDPQLMAALREGRAYLTDGVGRPIENTAVVFPGAIYRVVHSARRPAS